MRMPVSAVRLAGPLALSALCTLPAAAQGFEGTVSWQMGERAMEMNQSYKGTQVRNEMTGQGGRQGVMIMDMGARTMTMIMPERKMYMTMNMDAMKAEMDDMNHEEHKLPKLTDTGKSETIAGKSCEVYRLATEEGKPDTMELCAAKGMGFFMGGARGPMSRGNTNASIAVDLAGSPEFAKMYKDGFFPLRISRLENGQVKTEMIATKVEAKSLDASLFQVPSDYTEMKMPAGMGNMRRPQ
jgi:Domain of unknown function (DUF4412)